MGILVLLLTVYKNLSLKLQFFHTVPARLPYFICNDVARKSRNAFCCCFIFMDEKPSIIKYGCGTDKVMRIRTRNSRVDLKTIRRKNSYNYLRLSNYLQDNSAAGDGRSFPGDLYPGYPPAQCQGMCVWNIFI